MVTEIAEKGPQELIEQIYLKHELKLAQKENKSEISLCVQANRASGEDKVPNSSESGGLNGKEDYFGDIKKKVLKKYVQRLEMMSGAQVTGDPSQVTKLVQEAGQKEEDQRVSKFKKLNINVNPTLQKERKITRFCNDKCAFFVYKQRDAFHSLLSKTPNEALRPLMKNKHMKKMKFRDLMKEHEKSRIKKLQEQEVNTKGVFQTQNIPLSNLENLDNNSDISKTQFNLKNILPRVRENISRSESDESGHTDRNSLEDLNTMDNNSNIKSQPAFGCAQSFCKAERMKGRVVLPPLKNNLERKASFATGKGAQQILNIQHTEVPRLATPTRYSNRSGNIKQPKEYEIGIVRGLEPVEKSNTANFSAPRSRNNSHTARNAKKSNKKYNSDATTENLNQATDIFSLRQSNTKKTPHRKTISSTQIPQITAENSPVKFSEVIYERSRNNSVISRKPNKMQFQTTSGETIREDIGPKILHTTNPRELKGKKNPTLLYVRETPKITLFGDRPIKNAVISQENLTGNSNNNSPGRNLEKYFSHSTSLKKRQKIMRTENSKKQNFALNLEKVKSVELGIPQKRTPLGTDTLIKVNNIDATRARANSVMLKRVHSKIIPSSSSNDIKAMKGSRETTISSPSKTPEIPEDDDIQFKRKYRRGSIQVKERLVKLLREKEKTSQCKELAAIMEVCENTTADTRRDMAIMHENIVKKNKDQQLLTNTIRKLKDLEGAKGKMLEFLFEERTEYEEGLKDSILKETKNYKAMLCDIKNYDLIKDSYKHKSKLLAGSKISAIHPKESI